VTIIFFTNASDMLPFTKPLQALSAELAISSAPTFRALANFQAPLRFRSHLHPSTCLALIELLAAAP
jgi:hypothetical protein